MTVADLIRHLRKMPGDADILSLDIDIAADPGTDLVITFGLLEPDSDDNDDDPELEEMADIPADEEPMTRTTDRGLRLRLVG